jgi:hypothetical protein
MKLRMRDSAVSTKRNSFQHAGRISLKQSMLKNRGFSRRPETALGTVDRMIVFRYLQIGHLPKQQVVASDGADQHWCCRSALWKRAELPSPILATFVGAFLAVYAHPSEFK